MLRSTFLKLTGLAAAAAFTTACAGSGGMSAASSSSSASGGMAGAMSGSTAASGAAVQKVTPEEAHTRFSGAKDYILLDVRTAEEYAAGHIPGAALLPNEDIGTARPAQLPVLDTPIYVYCRSGRRSADAAAKLADMGYTALYDLGGISSWPYETETGEWQVPEKAGTLASFASFTLAGVPADESIFSAAKVTMVNVWATYCGPCLNEMPELGTLAAEYAGEGLQVVGIVSDVAPGKDGTYAQSDVENARSLVSETQAAYPHLLLSSDLAGALADVYAVPTSYFVDAAGQVLGDAYVGARSGDDWAAIAQEKLSEVSA